MHITKDHTGDILCLYQTGKRIQITDVSENLITYTEETGNRYGTNETHADAFVEKDPERIASFRENNELGKVLNAAESRALRTILSGRASSAERDDADRVLSIVREQQNHLYNEVMNARHTHQPGIALAEAFMTQLYEAGTGSHDTFFGHHVVNEGQMSGRFSVNGRPMDYSAAVMTLSEATLCSNERKAGLDQIISNADQRKTAESRVGLTPEYER